MRLRNIILPLAAVALTAAACNKSADYSNTNGSTAQTIQDKLYSVAAQDFRADMRKLWTEHVMYTHNYIIAAVYNNPDQSELAKRLLKNQDDIGDALEPYYGKTARDDIIKLLKDHINIAVDMVADAKANNSTKLKADSDKWKKNGTDIADYLAKANPKWKKDDLNDLLQMHLSTTADFLSAVVKRDGAAEVAAADKVYRHIVNMSDALTNGIIKQYPDKF